MLQGKLRFMSGYAQHLADAAGDIVSGCLKWRVWSALAWEEAKITYKRTAFGVLWIAASFGIFVLAKILVFGSFLTGTVSPNYFSAYLVIGFFVWQFLASVISNAPLVFISNESWLRNDPLPLSIFVFKSIFRSSFDLILTGIVTVIAVVALGFGRHYEVLTALAAMVVLIINTIWMVLILGVLCTRYRDIGHFVQAIMRILFFLSPIFWFPEQFSRQVFEILWWNPFAHFIWIFRSPVLDGVVPWESWIFVSLFTFVGWAVTFVMFAAFRRRIVFWI